VIAGGVSGGAPILQQPKRRSSPASQRSAVEVVNEQNGGRVQVGVAIGQGGRSAAGGDRYICAAHSSRRNAHGNLAAIRQATQQGCTRAADGDGGASQITAQDVHLPAARRAACGGADST